MSADNFYVVRKHPSGGFTYVCAFASDEDENGDAIYPVPNLDSPKFNSREEAMNEAFKLYAEYGYQYHWEVYTEQEKLNYIKDNAPDDQKDITIEEVDALWRSHDRK